jgi:(R,R)-butanediol dehydrogenase/meso-butanediol dehydrogenase/diacetyl reductase
MRQLAIDYHGAGVFKQRQYDPAAPAPDEVQIAVAYTGICGTDLTISKGAMDGRIKSPWPIGHEMSGTIAEIGSGVEGWQVGDKVTVMPLDWCGDCPACKAGNTHICHNLTFVGIDSPGSLQDRWNVKSSWLVRLPGDLDLRAAALVEPVAVAVHDVTRAGVASGDRVVVIGGGPIGLLIAIIARDRGAQVVISEVAASRLELAREFGFETVNPATQDLAAAVAEWTEEAGADIAFEVSGTVPGVKAMTDVLRRRGQGVIVGIQPQAPPVDVFQIFWKELQIIGARVYQRPDFEEAVRLVANGTIPTDALISDVMPLADVATAFERLAGGENIVKLLIKSES